MLTTRLLQALADERITFEAFAAKTRGDFMALAMNILRRHRRLPPALELDDLIQEMFLAVHASLPEFDANLGDLKKFIVFRACSAVRKELHRNTQSKKRDASMPWSADVQLPDQEDSHLAHQLLETLPIGDRQTRIIRSLARTGSLDDTTQELLAHPTTRKMFTNPRPGAARYSVYRTARKLAHRAQAIA